MSLEYFFLLDGNWCFKKTKESYYITVHITNIKYALEIRIYC